MELKMTRTHILCFATILVGAATAAGCSSDSSGCADGGDASCTAASDAANSDVPVGPQLFRLPAGDSCFVVTAVAPGTVDGCELGVATAATVDPANSRPFTLPLHYDAATGTVTLGTMGSLGGGIPVNNKATLVRVESSTSDSANPTCTWLQQDTTQFELTADAVFTVAVTEVERTFSQPCAVTFANDTCTSTWGWTMQQSTTKTPPLCL
jgi:hypothetical protein